MLFGDYRESQDAVASQDFGAFFNDAFPLPELGSPEHNFNEVVPSTAKPDIMAQVEAAQDGKEEYAPTEDVPKMMICNQIWFVPSLSIPKPVLIWEAGIGCNLWRSSATERLISTVFALT